MKTIYVGDYAKNYNFISQPGLGHWISTGVLNEVQNFIMQITSTIIKKNENPK